MGRRTIVLVVALALAALSAFAVFNYLNSVEDDIRGDIVEVKVFRATQGIPQGTPGNQASAAIEESTALKINIVFEGSTILCTGPTNPDDPADVCIDNPANLGDVLNGGSGWSDIERPVADDADVRHSPRPRRRGLDRNVPG